MAYYYKIGNAENEDSSDLEGIQIHKNNLTHPEEPHIKFDFSKHVLIELLDNVTPESKLWAELGLTRNKIVVRKRLLVDPHRVNCRRAIVICTSSEEAKGLAQRLTQAKIRRRCICAVVIQELLSDLILFEKQIMQFGDKRSQHQFVYVTDLSRRREPSGLAQYLREKFSPFGTIMSVLVSEDKDGYAHPEAVIRYAYLSEAFAAELAFDQSVVAMERLSVATHHNILLSQCDLRARLREAQLRYADESLACESPPSDGPPGDGFDSNQHDDHSDNASHNSGVSTEKNYRQFSPATGDYPSDSAELAEVLKKPCENNLMECLKSIALCSESSISKKTFEDAMSDSEGGLTEPGIAEGGNLRSLISSNLSSPTPVNKTWSTRVLGWITDLPSVNEIASHEDMTLNGSLENGRYMQLGVNKTQLSVNGQDKQNNENIESHRLNAIGSASSTAGSFVTCNNADFTMSYNSCSLSPISDALNKSNDPNNTTLQPDSPPLENTSHNSGQIDVQEDQISNAESENDLSAHNSLCAVPFSDSALRSISLSQKRKNSSLATLKLSMKTRRTDFNRTSSLSDCDTIANWPAKTDGQNCSVVLNSVPELDAMARNLANHDSTSASIATPATVISVASHSKQSFLLPTSPKSSTNVNLRVAKSPVLESLDRACSFNSPPRRSSRLALYDSDKSSNLNISSSIKNNTSKKGPVTPMVILLPHQKNISSDEKESPLRAWLRKELISSSNNRVSDSQESSKTIVCATVNKDVLTSVGCSHMICDFCYPDSTKLLLGYH